MDAAIESPFARYTRLTWFGEPDVVRESLLTLKQLVAEDVAVYWEGYAGDGGSIRIAPVVGSVLPNLTLKLTNQDTALPLWQIEAIAAAFGADPNRVAELAEDGYVSVHSKGSLELAFELIIAKPNDPALFTEALNEDSYKTGGFKPPRLWEPVTALDHLHNIKAPSQGAHIWESFEPGDLGKVYSYANRESRGYELSPEDFQVFLAKGLVRLVRDYSLGNPRGDKGKRYVITPQGKALEKHYGRGQDLTALLNAGLDLDRQYNRLRAVKGVRWSTGTGEPFVYATCPICGKEHTYHIPQQLREKFLAGESIEVSEDCPARPGVARASVVTIRKGHLGVRP